MTRIISICWLTICSGYAFSQSTSNNFQKLNSIQLEMSGGTGTFIPFALNYERIVYQSDKLAWRAKAGLSYRKWYLNHQKAATIELGATTLHPKHHFEFGLFASLQDGIWYYQRRTQTAPSYRDLYGINPPFYAAVRLGYRLQTPTGKWVLRAGILQPFLLHQTDESTPTFKIRSTYGSGKRLIIWPALSVGRAF